MTAKNSVNNGGNNSGNYSGNKDNNGSGNQYGNKNTNSDAKHADAAANTMNPRAKKGIVLTKKHEKYLKIAVLILLALYFVTAFIAYPMMPDIMPTHWGLNGEVDSYADKTVGVFAVPVAMVCIAGFVWYMKKYDRRRKHKSRLELERYDAGTAGILLLIVLYMYIIYVYTLLYALGMYGDMTYVILILMIPMFAGMFWFFNKMDLIKLK